MRKVLLRAYGLVSYLVTMATFFFLAGWLLNLPLPLAIDAGTPPPAAQGFLVNTILLAAYFCFHSTFARTRVKRRLRRHLPRNLERATYNLASALLLLLFCRLWQPMPEPVWEVTAGPGVPLLYGLFALAFLLHYASIFLINHNDFFGLRQVWREARGEAYRPQPPVSPRYYTASHALLALSLTMIPWFTPVMSVGHLYLAILWTGYMALGVYLSYRDTDEVLVASAPEHPHAVAPSV